MRGRHIREDIGMTVGLYAGSQRSSSTAPGRETRHSFSFGPHYDPANLGFGPLVCHNDDLLDPSASTVAGYPEHPHTELEIVTWVLEGALVHTDSSGHRHVVETGRAQVLSAGTGVRHSEVAAAPQTRFVQVWLQSSEALGEDARETLLLVSRGKKEREVHGATIVMAAEAMATTRARRGARPPARIQFTIGMILLPSRCEKSSVPALGVLARSPVRRRFRGLVLLR